MQAGFGLQQALFYRPFHGRAQVEGALNQGEIGEFPYERNGLNVSKPEIKKALVEPVPNIAVLKAIADEALHYPARIVVWCIDNE